MDNNMADAWMPPIAGKTWSTPDFINTFTMWMVMMVAMMMPAVMYMVLGFINIYRAQNHLKTTYLGTLFLFWAISLFGFYFVLP